MEARSSQPKPERSSVHCRKDPGRQGYLYFSHRASQHQRSWWHMADGKIVGRPAKLDAAQKKEVVRLLRAGQSTQAQIAGMAKVNRSVISRLASKIRVEEGDHGALQKALRPL